MKKICLFLCLVCCFGVNNAKAACKVIDDANCHSADEYLNVRANKGGGCYECDNKACGANTVFLADDAMVGERGMKKNEVKYTEEWKMYTCIVQGGNDWWMVEEPKFCDNAQQQGLYNTYANDPDIKSILDITPDAGKGRKIIGDEGHFVAVSEGTPCLKVKCKTGKAEKVDGQYKCVGVNKNCQKTGRSYAYVGDVTSIQCEKDSSTISGVLVSDGALNSLEHVVKNDTTRCSATCKDDGWDITLNANGCQNGYIPDQSAKSCIATKATQEQNRKAQENEAIKQCRATGGKWLEVGHSCSCKKDNTKDLVPGKTCQCESEDYEVVDGNCTKTDKAERKEECENAKKNKDNGVYGWDGAKCVCNESDKMYTFNRQLKKCEQDQKYARCMAQPRSVTDWIDGDCVCLNSDFEWYNSECVEKQSVVEARNAANATKRISDIMAKLNAKFKTFGVSVWKDESGNFNKARLASDSIAGVVLGTAGGLITSKVVKKNQVKTGFENIGCTIGGQKVADWSDEFTVGVQ